MTKAYKHILAGAFALVAAALISLTVAASSAWAAGAWPEVKLTPVGDNVNVTVVDEAGDYRDARALALRLDIDVEDGTENAISIGFDFSQTVKDSCTIYEQRPNPWTPGSQLELYVAGPTELLASGSLDLGTVVIGYDSAASSRSIVVVSVPSTGVIRAEGETSGGALRIVGGNYEEEAPNVYSQWPAAIYLGDAKNDIPNTGDDGKDGNGGNDPQVVNDPLRQNTNLTALSQTGDTLMPLVVTLLCVIALAAATMAFVVIRRRSHKG